MPLHLLSTRALLFAVLFLVCSVVFSQWRSRCHHDGLSAVSCLTLDHLTAAMSATFTTVPASYLRYATRSLPSYLRLREPLSQMPLRQHRPYSSDAPAKSTFTYRLAAAAAGKRTPSRAPKAGQDYWGYASTQANATPPYLRSTKPNSGEDAFFAATVGGSKHHVAFGVADGVGGWQDQGVDPSDFSHGLCGLMAGTAYIHEGLEAGKNVRPQQLMQTAYEAVIGNPRILAGGCTASLAVVDGAGGMETANLGDSGFLLFSPGKVAHRSQIQTHAFNTPYQLSKIPPKMQAQNAIFGGSAHFSETPAQADVERYQLKHGDVVLFATDGVWDNLSAQDTLGIVTKVMEEHGYWFKSHNFPGAESLLNGTLIRSLPQKVDGKAGSNAPYLPGLLATAVMREAKSAGLDTRRNGPFAKEVNLHYPHEGWRGGKPDDIAVVVCVAVEDAAAIGEEPMPIKAKL